MKPVARSWCAAGLFLYGVTACTREPERPVERAKADIRVHTDASSQSFGSVDVVPLNPRELAAFAARARLEDWHRVFKVGVAGDSTTLPILGTYMVRGETLRFQPRFPPAPATMYSATFNSRALNDQTGGPTTEYVVTSAWRVPARAGVGRTIVERIYPSPDELPMNLLRMYVHFSAPMSTGKAYDYIKLYADGESLIPEPFFTAGGMVELWDPQKTRLTILFDPGRIKRDLRPREEMGLPLRRGGHYRLVIDSTWPDAQGRPMFRHYVKRFRVGPQDRTLIRTETWIVRAPTAGTRDSLRLQFPEPLDHALLQRLLTVRDSSGRVLDGTVVVGARETRWAFTPAQPWKGIAHFLVVDTELEDLAGNSLKKLFDVAPGDSTGVDAPAVRLRFTPR